MYESQSYCMQMNQRNWFTILHIVFIPACIFCFFYYYYIVQCTQKDAEHVINNIEMHATMTCEWDSEIERKINSFFFRSLVDRHLIVEVIKRAQWIPTENNKERTNFCGAKKFTSWNWFHQKKVKDEMKI